MASRTSRLMPPAERFYVGTTDQARRELDRIIRNLCVDPWVNNKTTFAIIVQPAIMTLYKDASFWIMYHLPDPDSLSVMNIGPAATKVRSG